MSSTGIPQFLGDNTLKFEVLETLFGPKGNTSRFKVFSPSVGALVAYYNYIVQFGASGTISGTDNGANRAMEIELPGLSSSTAGVLEELFFDQWELLTNEGTDSIFANPLIVSGGSPILNYNDKVVLSRLSRDGGTISAAVASCNSDIGTGNLTAPTPPDGGTSDGKFQKPTAGGAATQLTLEILKGQTEYEAPNYVLRHTSYCSAGALYNTSTANTQCIYTPAQLLTEVGSGWTYNLPPRLYSKIAGIPFQSAASIEAPYYRWGWLKKITRETVLANFMVEVSTEYALALWSTIRYSPR